MISLHSRISYLKYVPFKFHAESLLLHVILGFIEYLHIWVCVNILRENVGTTVQSVYGDFYL